MPGPNASSLHEKVERYISRLHQEDRDNVRNFVRDLIAQGYSPARVLKYMASLVMVSRQVRKPLRELTEEDVKEWAGWLNTTRDYKEWTKYDLITILRRYLRWLGKGDMVSWLKPKRSRNNTTPEEVLTEEEIKRMAEAAITNRDKAFVLALYESGARIGEFLPLKLKHVSFDRYGAVLRLSGKTGDRRVRLVFSALPLQHWLEEHPGKDDPEAYLWCQIPAPYHPADKVKRKHVSYGFVNRLLRELAQKAGVRKRVNPHAFRHARATFLARHLKEPEMREFFGWGKDSEMPAVYVHLSGRDVDTSVLAVYGMEDANKRQEPVLKPEPCPRCQEQNDPAAKFCRRCGLPLGESFLTEEYELREEIQRLKEEMQVLAEVKDLLADIRAIKLLASTLSRQMK